MDNLNDFTKRLQKLLDYYNLSASGLASKIGIQRSTISHVISGRNKPSLDFVMKLLNNFDELSIEWLIDGKGVFPKESINSNTTPPLPYSTSKNIKEQIDVDKSKEEITSDLELKKNPKEKIIEKVIIFYKDGSFQSYVN